FPSLAVAGSSAWWSGPAGCGGWAGRETAASSAPARAVAGAETHPTLRPWSKALVAAWWTAAAAALWPFAASWPETPNAAPTDWRARLLSEFGNAPRSGGVGRGAARRAETAPVM